QTPTALTYPIPSYSPPSTKTYLPLASSPQYYIDNVIIWIFEDMYNTSTSWYYQCLRVTTLRILCGQRLPRGSYNRRYCGATPPQPILIWLIWLCPDRIKHDNQCIRGNGVHEPILRTWF